MPSSAGLLIAFLPYIFLFILLVAIPVSYFLRSIFKIRNFYFCYIISVPLALVLIYICLYLLFSNNGHVIIIAIVLALIVKYLKNFRHE